MLPIDKQLIELTQTYKRFFDDDGKRVLENLESICGYNKTSFVNSDPHRVSFNEGKRYVYLYILACIEGKVLLEKEENE